MDTDCFKMQNHFLGATQIKVSPLCWGTWSLGWHSHSGHINEEKVFEIVDTIGSLGINFIDTAPLYGFGLSERLLGRVLKDRRDQFVLSTKCGFYWTQETYASLKKSVSRDSILRECEMSLERLQTDFIDLYLIHFHDDKTPVSESMKAMQELKDQGMIKSYGVCNFSLDLLKKACHHGEISVLQSRLSRLRPEITPEMRAFCIENNISIQAYTPLERGILTDQTEIQLRKKEEPNIQRALQNAPQDYLEKKTKWLREAREEHLSLAQASVRWVSRLKGVTSVILGSQNTAHIEEIASIFS